MVNSCKGQQGGHGGIDSGRLVSSRNFYYKSTQNFSNTSRRTLNRNDKVRAPNVTVTQNMNTALGNPNGSNGPKKVNRDDLSTNKGEEMSSKCPTQNLEFGKDEISNILNRNMANYHNQKMRHRHQLELKSQRQNSHSNISAFQARKDSEKSLNLQKSARSSKSPNLNTTNSMHPGTVTFLFLKNTGRAKLDQSIQEQETLPAGPSAEPQGVRDNFQKRRYPT